MHRPPARRSRVLSLAVAAVVVATSGLLVTTAGSAAAATCADIDVVAARGTNESGTLGTIVGDPVFAALQNRLSSTKTLSSYRVNYPASLAAGSASQGNADLVNHVNAQAAACPAQKFILVGYSQGANVVDNSVGISSQGALVGAPIVAVIPSTVEPRVAALLLFGNPIRAIGRSINNNYQARTLDICANGDPVCQAGGLNFFAHLSYTRNAGQAADFAASLIQRGGG
jgi:cutinase